MKVLLFLLLPVFGYAQTSGLPLPLFDAPIQNKLEIVCTRTHIDTIKNVEWYVEVRADTGFLNIPLSIGCPKNNCTFVHTHNDISREDHWYDVYQSSADSWTYYIHEVRVVALKPKGQPIIYPNDKLK